MSIQAKDLRIGNWVKFGVNYVYIKGLHTDTFYNIKENIKEREYFAYVGNFAKFGSYCFSLNELFPIELTTDILEKCGFEHIWDWDTKDNRKNDCSMFLDLGYLYIAQNIMGGITLFQYDNISTGVNFSYLHQLQNCIYALTNKELEINLQ